MSIRQINQSHRYSNVKYIVKSHNMFGIYHRMRFRCIIHIAMEQNVKGLAPVILRTATVYGRSMPTRVALAKSCATHQGCDRAWKIAKTFNLLTWRASEVCHCYVKQIQSQVFCRVPVKKTCQKIQLSILFLIFAA